MITKKQLAMGALVVGLAASMSAQAGDVVVIVNKANANALDKDFLIKAYSGDVKNWPDGSTLQLIDQGEENPIRAEFDSAFLGKQLSKMKITWAKNTFTGKALPPKVVDGDDAVKKAVAGNKDAIGYIGASSADSTVKVILK